MVLKKTPTKLRKKAPRGLTTDVLRRKVTDGPKEDATPAAAEAKRVADAVAPAPQVEKDRPTQKPKVDKHHVMDRTIPPEPKGMGEKTVIIRRKFPPFTGTSVLPMDEVDPETGKPIQYPVEFLEGRADVPEKVWLVIQRYKIPGWSRV